MYFWTQMMIDLCPLIFLGRQRLLTRFYMQHLHTQNHWFITFQWDNFLVWKESAQKDQYFEQKATELHHRFRERGYPTHSINRAYRRAKQSPRKELMKGCTKKETPHQVRFITLYQTRWREIKSVLKKKKHWDILWADNILTDHLTTRPSITYRRSWNLCDMLFQSHHTGLKIERAFGSKDPRWGCCPCGNCVACCNMDTAYTFWNSQQTREFKITHHITCNMTGVIYFALCPCGLIYVGLTTRQFRRRIREHVLGITATQNESVILICWSPSHVTSNWSTIVMPRP